MAFMTLTAELLSRVSTFNEETERKEKTIDEVYYNTFLAMYWLAKDEIANTKFVSLLELLEQVGLKDLKFFQLRSAGSIREMFLLLGKVVRDTVTNPFSDVRSFGLLCDEASDVVNKEQLITFVKFVNSTATAVEEWLVKPRRKLPRYFQEMFNKL